MLPAFADLKMHDLCAGPDDLKLEALDMRLSLG